MFLTSQAQSDHTALHPPCSTWAFNQTGGPAGWAMNGQVSGSPAKLPGLLEKATLAHESPELPAGSCMGHIAHNGLMWLNSSPVNILIS